MFSLTTLPKNVYKNILLWAVLYIASMIVNILAFPFGVVIALISVIFGEDKIPSIFNWWLTHDNPIDGDEWHIERWNKKDTKWYVFLRRTAWLWRNKGYQFDYRYLGKPIGNTLINYGDPLTSDQGREGILFQYDENGTWEFYLVKRYPFNLNKCLRLRFGWKIDDLRVGTGERMMIATSIGLWKSFVSKL